AVRSTVWAESSTSSTQGARPRGCVAACDAGEGGLVPSAHPHVEDPMGSYAMLINGRSVTTPEQDDVINPARGDTLATCPRGTRAHVDEAVAAAAAAYKSWKKDEALRRATLNECSAAIQGHAQEIATVLSQEQGKPLAAAMGETYGASMW